MKKIMYKRYIFPPNIEQTRENLENMEAGGQSEEGLGSENETNKEKGQVL